MEKSYENITVKEATRMLFFQNDAKMKEYSVKVNSITIILCGESQLYKRINLEVQSVFLKCI